MMLIKHYFPKCSALLGTRVKTVTTLWHYTVKRYAGKGSAKEDHSRIPWHPERHTCIINVGSPINIASKKTAPKDFLPFKFAGFGKPLDLVMANNGHLVTIDLPEGAVEYSGGGMVDTFKAHHIHFHWGTDSSSGSEHYIDGRKYAMEDGVVNASIIFAFCDFPMHIVTYNAGYADVRAARPSTSGISVLAILFKVTMGANQHLTPIVENLRKIQAPYSAARIQLPSILSILPDSLKDFYQYTEYNDSGLPTLTWTVFSKTVHISETQIIQFRKLNSPDTFIGTKERVPLPANNRAQTDLLDMQVFRNSGATQTKPGWKPSSIFGIKKKGRLLDS